MSTAFALPLNDVIDLVRRLSLRTIDEDLEGLNRQSDLPSKDERSHSED
jgi:hypothetical protein